MEPAGRGTLLWSYSDSASSIHRVLSSSRATRGDFGPMIPTNSAGNFVITPPKVGFDLAGRAIVAWLSLGGVT